jgi:hypothetical protein
LLNKIPVHFIIPGLNAELGLSAELNLWKSKKVRAATGVCVEISEEINFTFEPGMTVE